MRLFRSRIEKAHHGADPDEVYAYARLEESEKEAAISIEEIHAEAAEDEI